MMKFSRISVLNFLKLYSNQSCIRSYSEQKVTNSLVHLDQRTLLRLTGDEISDFLQGLITNDMKHLKEGAMSIYSVFLNIKGRVLYDTIIYKTQEDKVLYVECDASIVNDLLKHLKIYKLRRKVDIQKLEDNIKIWSVYNSNVLSEENNLEKKSKFEGKIFPCEASDNKSRKIIDGISIYNDPRITELGLRILTASNITPTEIIKHLESNITIQNISDYRAFRYRLGVGEGVQDFPPGSSFPLEINCDYLHGVSFHKGCYIGQELTARTHHTGVVRKRLMPLIFNNTSEQPLEFNEKIINETGKIIGKVKGQEGLVGLGSIRITEALASKTLIVKNCVLKVLKPEWWPQESQKIEASSSKN